MPRLCRLLLATVAFAGCHWSIDSVPIDPKSYQFYFPTGIAMDPGGQYAYVANANADLAFGGGTLMVVDMLRFECTLARWKQRNDGGPTPPAVCHPEDAGVQALRDYDAMVAHCQRDIFDTSIVDCDESEFILMNSTVKIGNFAGEIRVQRLADETHRRLYVLVRGDPSVTWVDVRFPGPTDPTDPTDTYRPSSVGQPGLLQCVDNPRGFAAIHPVAGQVPIPRGCDTSHLLQQYLCHDQPNCLAGLYNNGVTQLANEPIGMQIDQGKMPDGKQYSRLLVSHQSSGQVTLIDLQPRTPQILYTSVPFFQPDANTNHGAFSIAEQHRHDPTSAWYVTSDLFSEVDTFRIAQNNVVLPESQISLQSTFTFGNDVRDIQFVPSGDRAFITVNNPPVVLDFDARVLPGMNGGLPVNQVVNEIDVCQMPSHVRVRRVLAPGAPREPAQLKTQIYVVCFLSSQVMVVDPDFPDVNETIFSGIGGPNEIAFNFSDADAEPADQITQLLPRRAYVTNFTESTIGVIDVEPGSPTEGRVIARVGYPPTGLQP